MDQHALRFLKAIFPDKSEAKLNAAFGWVYEKGRFGENESADDRRREMAELDRIQDDVANLQRSGNAKIVRSVCNRLPHHALKFLKSNVDIATADPTEIVYWIADYKKMIAIWNRGNSIAGGKYIGADSIAKAVKLAFEDIKKPATFGHDPYPKGFDVSTVPHQPTLVALLKML